jgi:predicted phage terminase large subunit-like protein
VKNLTALINGEIENLLVLMPPRGGKSHLASEIFPSWVLGKMKSSQVLFSSYNSELATDFGRKVRTLCEDPKYKLVFDTTVSGDSSANSRFHLSNNSAYFATGIGGSVVGRGYDIGILDDPYKKMQDSLSDVYQKNLHEWFFSTFLTRRLPKARTLVIQTIWSQNDIGYKLIDDPKWTVLKIPAITDDTSFWPDRFSLEYLLELKKHNPRSFEALYQQSPRVEEGNLIQKQHIKFYRTLPPNFDEMIQSWDLTFDSGEKSDFCVGSVYGRHGSNIYLVDQVRGRWDVLEQMKQIQYLTAKYPKTLRKLIEKAANGAAVITMLESKIMGIIPVKPSKSKVDRVMSVLPLYEAGNVLYPDPDIAPWIEDHIDEVLTFPNGRNDDRVDAESQSCEHFAQHLNSFMRIEALSSM